MSSSGNETADELAIRGKKVVQPAGIAPACLHIRNGVIAAITEYDDVPARATLIDAGELAILPGVVDTHVHLNDPGRDHWEGFYTGTRAAAAGGVTTLVDMPLNSIPPTTSVEGLQAKLKAAEGCCWVDVGLWGGVVPGNANEIEPLLAQGVLGFKCFVVNSGVSEFPFVSEGDLREALPLIAKNGSVLLVHAESPGPIAAALVQGDSRSYATYLGSRPAEAELEAIGLLIGLCREIGARIHIVHLSAADAILQLEGARRLGLPVSVETCPHYLMFKAEQIPDGATEFKCAPPIREESNRERLWRALESGVIDLIATDHSPCPPEMKATELGDFFQAWGGIASLQFGLAAVWTEARKRGAGLDRLSEWLCAAPARLAGLAGRKGTITIGADADLIFFDSDRRFDWNRPIEHRHKLTPYRGRQLQGVVERTILRGCTIYSHGQFQGEPGGAVVRSGFYSLNHASREESEAAFLRCCGSKRWARTMASGRPYANFAELAAAAESAAALDEDDWLEAFAAHPRIGGRSNSSWSKEEQSSMKSADELTRGEIAVRNEEYLKRFGFIFIICAAGKSSAEMLEQLRARQSNTREEEIRIAAREQKLITLLRLRKLLGS